MYISVIELETIVYYITILFSVSFSVSFYSWFIIRHESIISLYSISFWIVENTICISIRVPSDPHSYSTISLCSYLFSKYENKHYFIRIRFISTPRHKTLTSTYLDIPCKGHTHPRIGPPFGAVGGGTQSKGWWWRLEWRVVIIISSELLDFHTIIEERKAGGVFLQRLWKYKSLNEKHVQLDYFLVT